MDLSTQRYQSEGLQPLSASVASRAGVVHVQKVSRLALLVICRRHIKDRRLPLSFQDDVSS